jgi:hypothetical protein
MKFVHKKIVEMIMIIVKGVDRIKGTERIKWMWNFYAMQPVVDPRLL